VVNGVGGRPCEVFILVGRAGSEVQPSAQALGPVISACLRLDGDLGPKHRLDLLAKQQLRGIGRAHQTPFGADRVSSAVDGIGHLLGERPHKRSRDAVCA
jgi:ribonucleoside-diphosphate reductase alpha chain